MVSKLFKGRGLGLQVSCKSFPTVYSWLRRYVDRPRDNDLQLLYTFCKVSLLMITSLHKRMQSTLSNSMEGSTIIRTYVYESV